MNNADVESLSTERLWTYQSQKNYEWCIGKKAFLCTQWDKGSSKVNLSNYGTITDVTPDYITMQSGKYKNFKNLQRYVCYSHDNIYKFYLKTSGKSIRKMVKDVNKNNSIITQEKQNLHKSLIQDNFITL